MTATACLADGLAKWTFFAVVPSTGVSSLILANKVAPIATSAVA
jgi:hypothetical protein